MATRIGLPLLLAALAACTGETPSEKDSAPPVDDSDPVDPPPAPTVRLRTTEPRTDDDLVAEVVGADAAFTYRWSWSVDGADRPDLTDPTVPAAETAKGQLWAVTVVAEADGLTSAPASASVTVLNTPPTATLTLDPLAPTAEQAITALPVGADVDGDEVTFDLRWTVDGIVTAQTGDTLPAGSAAKGMLVRVEATPRDGEETGSAVASTVTVINGAPRVTGTTIQPAAPTTLSTITGSATRSDPDGDATTLTYTWLVDGVPIAGVTGASLPEQHFSKGQAVRFQVEAGDGFLRSAPVLSDAVTVVNSPPDATGATLSSSSTRTTVLSTLTCAGVGYRDVDGDAAGWQYRWQIDGVEIVGATDAALVSPAFARGDQVTCSAAAFDGAATGPWLGTLPVQIQNAPPTVASASLSTYTLREGEAATASYGTTSDPDGDTVDVTLQWYVEGVPGPTGPTLSPLLFSAGDEVWVVATPWDGIEYGTPVTSPVGVVNNSPPVATSASIRPSAPTTTQTLVATAEGTDADGHRLTWTYAWTVDGAEVQRSTSDTLAASLSSRGDQVRVTAIPNDGYVDGTPVTSAPVTIQNSPPSVAAATLGPVPATETTTLTCTAVAYSDPDGDLAANLIQWLVNGAQVPRTGPTLQGADFDKGDAVRCTLTPSDGDLSGTPVQSDPVTIDNSLPSLTGVTLSTLTPSTSTTLSATPVGAFDADGDGIELRYDWRVDGVSVSASPTLPPPFFSQGALITVTVRPWDGEAEGLGVTSAVAVVQNARPVVETLVIEPEAPTLAQDAVAVWTATDADGDPLTPTFTWALDGVAIPGVTGPVLDRSLLVRGAELVVTLVVHDGFEDSAPVTSLPALVENTPPVGTTVQIDPTLAYEGSTLTCVPGPATDAEGDTIQWFFLWRVNGFPMSEAQTINGSLFDKGNVVTCAAAPSDGLPGGLGAAITSHPVTIQNSPPTLTSASLSTLTPTESTTLVVTAGSRSDPDLDAVQLRYAWRVNGVDVGVVLDRLTGAQFRKGDTIQAFVTPTDTITDGAPVATAIATVQNSPPAIVSVQVSPTTPRIDDTITAVAIGSDADGDSLTWTYDWLIDGVSVQTGTSPTLPPTVGFQAGQRVWVIATASDGSASSAPLAATPVRIQNSPPTMTGAAITPTTIFEATTASCTASGWFDADGDPPGYLYQWLVNGVPDVSTQTITGLRFRKGDSLVCRVTPWDLTDTGIPVDSAPVVVSNTPPVLGTVTLDRTAPTEASTVGVVIGSQSDADNDPLIVRYQWLVNGAPSVTTATITGASFRKGDRLACDVTLDDGAATDIRRTNEVTVVNSLPVVNTLSIAPTAPDTVTSVTATWTTSDIDGDTVTVAFEWLVDGVAVPGVTGPTLTGDRFVKHQTIQVRATPNDGEANGGVLTSNTATVVNTPPVAAGISVSGRSITRLSSLRCIATGMTDLDGDAVVSTTRWYVNGTQFTTSDTLNGALLTRGQTVFCDVRPYDGEEYGNTITSSTYTVENAPPVLGPVTMNPASPKEGDVVNVSTTGATDADGDIVTLRYSWRVNGTQISTMSSIDSSVFRRGDTITVVVTPNDTLVDGTSQTAGPVTVVNAPPIVTALPALLPTPADKRNPITASGLSGSDPDGDPSITWFYQFYVNGTLVQHSTSNVLPISLFSKGNTVYVAVYGNDTFGSGVPVATAPITVQNAPPSLPSISFTPTLPVDADPLTCTITTPGTDADGDTVTHEMKWVLNGADYGVVLTTTTITLRADQTQVAQVWKCAARSFDGTTRSAWREVTRSIAPATMSRQSCADLRAMGHLRTGWHGLDDGAGGVLGAWCDQSTLGGGWTRVARTEGAERDWGQATWDLAQTVAWDAPEGLYEPFDTVRNVREVLLRQTSGAQVGRYAAYQLYGDSEGLTLRELLEVCRDEDPRPGDDSAWLRPAVVGHTSFASGERYAGDLMVYDRHSGLPGPAERVLLCGLNVSGPNDVSYLAFTDRTGQDNDWGDGWWGPGQPGTLWSLASGPYGPDAPGHLGSEGIQSFAGWKGDGWAWPALMHEGAYEVFVR